ncbi:MAG: hypothetical protein OXN26_11585 [Gammaproteobacteria bacterium]|nr:hypothetical protein [Gammaproteobacteria bacterium]
MEDIEGRPTLEDEASGEKRVPVNVSQQVQKTYYLLNRTGLVPRLTGDAL